MGCFSRSVVDWPSRYSNSTLWRPDAMDSSMHTDSRSVLGMSYVLCNEERREKERETSEDGGPLGQTVVPHPSHPCTAAALVTPPLNDDSLPAHFISDSICFSLLCHSPLPLSPLLYVCPPNVPKVSRAYLRLGTR